MLFLLMIVLNAFLFVHYCSTTDLYELGSEPPKQKVAERVIGLHLITCIAALLLKILTLGIPALIVCAIPVAMAGIKEIIAPVVSGLFTMQHPASNLFYKTLPSFFPTFQRKKATAGIQKF